MVVHGARLRLLAIFQIMWLARKQCLHKFFLIANDVNKNIRRHSTAKHHSHLQKHRAAIEVLIEVHRCRHNQREGQQHSKRGYFLQFTAPNCVVHQPPRDDSAHA